MYLYTLYYTYMFGYTEIRVRSEPRSRNASAPTGLNIIPLAGRCSLAAPTNLIDYATENSNVHPEAAVCVQHLPVLYYSGVYVNARI